MSLQKTHLYHLLRCSNVGALPFPRDRMKLLLVRESRSREKLNTGVQLWTKQNVEADHQDDVRAFSSPPPRPLVESKRNKRATRARMQNNAPRRARPSRRNPSPRAESKSMDRSTLDPCTRVLAFRGARNPAERLQLYRRQETRTSVENARRREVRRKAVTRGKKRVGTPSSVTEGTIKRHFRPGNSRYLKLRSQISNAENRY